MSCARCEELEERIAWLESELGLQREADVLDAIISRMGRQAAQVGRPGIARTIACLYAARGRPVSKWNLLEASGTPTSDEDRNIRVVDIYVSRARQVMGFGAVRTVRGFGYALAPEGVEWVERALGVPRRRAA